MRTEALFFKTLFLVFIAFYVSSLLIFPFMFVIIKGVDGFFDVSIGVVLGALFGVSLIASILFSPALLLISFIQWWIKNNKLKNLISFLLIIIYGFLILKFPSFRFYNTNFHGVIDETLIYLSLSIPSTLLFLILLLYLTQYKKNRT